MKDPKHKDLIEEATLAFTLGENVQAITIIDHVISEDPNSFEAWLAKTEILFSERNLASALQAAEKAYAINPNDIFINTSLSRIWIEKRDKKKAEFFGAQARMLGWKEQILEAENS